MKQEKRLRRKKHIRKKIFGTAQKPRMCVYKSLTNIYIQWIDDENKKVMFGISTLTPSVKKEIKYGGNIKSAKILGKKAAELCKEKGIETVVFDRNGFIYHGRIKALADAAREAGLKF